MFSIFSVIFLVLQSFNSKFFSFKRLLILTSLVLFQFREEKDVFFFMKIFSVFLIGATTNEVFSIKLARKGPFGLSYLKLYFFNFALLKQERFGFQQTKL